MSHNDVPTKVTVAMWIGFIGLMLNWYGALAMGLKYGGTSWLIVLCPIFLTVVYVYVCSYVYVRQP